MKKPTRQNGSVLLPVMFVIVLSAVIIGAASTLTSEQTLLTSRSTDEAALQTTAEGVLDYAYGVWRDQMSQGTILTGNAANQLVSGSNAPALPTRMSYDQNNPLTIKAVNAHGATVTGGKNATPSTNTTPSDGDDAGVLDYSGATVYTYVASVTLHASGIGGDRAVTLMRNFVYTAVPPARGMFFSDGNFELYKPAKMVINGDVHTNSDAHISTGTSSTNVTFLANSQVTYVGNYDHAAPPGSTNWSTAGDNYTPTYVSGEANQVSKVSAITGIGLGTATEYDTTDNNPNNDGNRELIEPPVAGYPDPPSIANSRLYNTAGLLITVTGLISPSVPLTLSGNTYSGGNLSIKAQNGTTLTAAQALAIRSAITNTTKNSSNQTVQSTLYDKREVQSVPVTTVDVGVITPILNALTQYNSTTQSGFNNAIYIYDTSSTKNAVRVTDGAVLPTNGLTIATEGGMYVQGDYNTGAATKTNPVPSDSTPSATASTTVNGYSYVSAALVADAIMVLSNGWSDSNASSPVASRNATNTTLNTALISGYVASTADGQNGRSGYSGGMNNFPRLLETWSGDSLTFNGAFVSLYQSKKFTGQWDTGDIYVPPTRYWSFDSMLLKRVLPGIPPGTSLARGPMIRG